MKLKYFIFLAFLALAACSPDTKVLPLDPAGNSSATFEAAEVSFFEDREAGVHVYEVDAKCELVHLGYQPVTTKKEPLRFNLASGARYLVEFVMVTSSSGGSHVTRISTLVKPKKGMSYQIEGSYLEAIKLIRLFEANPSGKKTKLEAQGMTQCS